MKIPYAVLLIETLSSNYLIGWVYPCDGDSGTLTMEREDEE